ncbi:MAG TPA: TOBE domain-containing protein, partial [Burkholderiaceae bacterium]|nr:TOBE domain-containing protein [Burkholderiaceae bacterium]
VVYVTHDQAEAMSMADQVVLLSQGRVEQNGAPRELYAKPATTFAARFIGTPPMNLITLEAGRIAGSTVDTGLPAAATVGIRPEDIVLDAGGVSPGSAAPERANPARREGAEGPKGASVIADVRSVEYLGADLVLACAIGSQTVLVRTDGQHQAQAGERIGLKWAPHDVHAFDAAGRRIH